MQIIEFIKQNNPTFILCQQQAGWILQIKNPEQQAVVNNFFIKMLQKAELRSGENIETVFTDEELRLLMKFFSLNGYGMQRKDIDLENKLKEVLSLVDTQNAEGFTEMVDSMTYYDQLILANKIVN